MARAFARQRKQDVVICVAGMAGSGKTTVARELAKRMRLRYLSGGDILKAIAVKMGYTPQQKGWWETEEGTKFLEHRMQDNQFDKKVDEKLIKEAKKGNVVLDSRTMPWLLTKAFKIWLEASLQTRAKRIANRNEISLENALRSLRERDKNTTKLYRSLYGFTIGKDFSPFHLVLDTNELDADEVLLVLSMVVEQFIGKKPNR